MSNKSLENYFSIIEKTAKLIDIEILDEIGIQREEFDNLRKNGVV